MLQLRGKFSVGATLDRIYPSGYGIAMPEGGPSTPMAKQTCPKPRILFVDDEASIRLTLPRVLAKLRFDVTSVGSLDEALAEIQNEQFDILLSDLNLPQPNAGFAIIEAMRKAQPRCINFILTGYPADESFRRANGHDVAHYFIKPVDIEEMVETMKNKLAAQESSAPGCGEAFAPDEKRKGLLSSRNV
jgi:DNA-binding NtrC family response regulator